MYFTKISSCKDLYFSIGKNRVDILLAEAIEAVNYLECEPVSTDDYVAYIKFIDKAQQKIDVMEGQLDYIKELYDTMEKFNIPVPAENMANYLVIIIEFINSTNC